MGAIAQSRTGATASLTWLREFLRQELAPYTGRASLVSRMVVAATLTMIIGVTYEIPYTAFAVLFAFTLSRESLEGTRKAAGALIVGSVLAGVYVVVGAMLVLGDPMLRFVWVGVTLFLAFYGLSALRNYTVAARFAYLTVITIPLWDSRISTASKVTNTLWAVGAISLGSITTLLMEIAFAGFRRTDQVRAAIMERLVGVEDLLTYFASDQPVPATTRSVLARLASVGISRLREVLHRSGDNAQHKQELGAVVALVGRLVDITVNLSQFRNRVTDDDRNRIRTVAGNIAEIGVAVTSGTIPRLVGLPAEGQAPSGVPLLEEIERTVSLIHDVLTGARSASDDAPPGSYDRGQAAPLMAGALSDPEHVKFALRGCLAAGLCYIIYNALFWPGISTAITTCLLTALTTIGASHQKQFLRFMGAIIGGLVIGIGAQVFILPNIDSIGGFTVLFIAVAVLSAWIATSSPRLSYLGVQVVAAYCLINLQEFKFQTSLAVARDRVVGILLGLFMMWLAFDFLWSAPAGVAMKSAFVSVLRLLAQLAREPISPDLRVAVERSYSLRETINTQFDRVRSLADGVLFEFGPTRQQDLALRDRIRQWQPQLRTLFLMRVASLKYRLQLPGFELPEPVRLWQRQYDDHSAGILCDMADRIEGNAPEIIKTSPGFTASGLPELTDERSIEQVKSFRALISGIEKLTSEVAERIARDCPTPGVTVAGPRPS
jgi:multidrug resistance protein MdtO